jgi:DNA-binding XRE family transcriptional regulator
VDKPAVTGSLTVSWISERGGGDGANKIAQRLLLIDNIGYYSSQNIVNIDKTAKIVSMNNIRLEQQTPADIASDIAHLLRKRRKEHGYSQEELSQRSGVSLGSLKRFETQHEISLRSLIKLALALGCEDDFTQLFVRKHYRSIQEVIDEQNT